MRIAQIHNKYTDLGGEDIVVAREKVMLEAAGHQVVQFFVSNADLNSKFKKLKAALKMTHNKTSERAVISFLKSTQPDVVHVHNFLPVLSPSVFEACKKENIPVVLTLHNFRLLCINGLLYRNNQPCEKCIGKSIATPGIKHGCYQDSSLISIFPTISNAINSKNQVWQNKIDKVIFLSEFSKQIFDKSHLKFRSSQIVIKPNFVLDKGKNFIKKDFYLFVGRISEEKGINTIIEAFEKNGKSLKIAGTGPMLNELKANVHSSIDIEFLGFQNQEQLAALYKNAKALLFASKMYEGNPLVILEAFSYGTPVIAPNFGNAGELVTEGYNGLKYTLNSSKSLVDTLQAFEKRDTIEISKNARETFIEYYTEKENLEMLEQIYKSSIN